MPNSLKDLELSSEELEANTKIRGTKGYKSMSEDAFPSPKPVKKVKNQKQIFLKQE